MNGNRPIHILVVDDEPEIRELLRKLFEREGFSVTQAHDGAGLFAALEGERIDLVTLDLGLPAIDGLTLARQVRAVSNVPIVMITGKDDTIDRVVGLELGADDYIAKPFHLREVLARVRAVLRRREATGETLTPSTGTAGGGERFHFAGYCLDVTSRAVSRMDGAALDLTTAEFDLLLILVRRPGRVLSRDVLMDLLKGHDWSPLDRTIDNLVGRVRKKLGDDGHQLIKSIRGVGYVLSAPVTRG